MRARLDPLARSPLGSIWTSVTRRDFERNIDELWGKNFIFKPRDYTGEGPSHEKDVIAALPLDIERKLADDFAYISAYDVGVDHITAATIEYSPDSPGITVRLAANEGVEDCVQAAIKEVLQVLKECDRRRSHRERSEEQLLSIVVHLNKNRIYSRLRSRHQKKRTDGQRVRLLSLDLQTFVGQQDKQTRNKPQELTALLGDVDGFGTLVEQLESSKNPEPMDELKKVVKKAWLIAEKKIGIEHRFKRLGVLSDRLDNNNTIRDMDKLANYWRICQDLVKLRQTREHRRLFDDPQLEAIENYKYAPSASKEGARASKRYVHAEIQLLAYYEGSGNKTSARIIGASREACFLCDAFIRAHGCFSVSKAHRQVKNIWTVPERKDYGVDSLKRIRRSIMAVNREIRQEVVSKQPREAIPPKQSSINLKSVPVISPTMSVVSSILSGRFSTASIRELAGEMSISTVMPRGSQAGLKENGLATLGGSSSSRNSSASTIRPVKDRPSTSAEQPVAQQDTTSNGTLTPSSSAPTVAKESATAHANGDYPSTANARASETKRQSLEKTAEADTTGLDSAIQLAVEPATQDEKEKRHGGRLFSPSPGTKSHGRERRRVSPGSPAHVRLGKLSMHVYLEESLAEDEDCTRASVSLVPLEECASEADSAVDLRSMAAGDELVVGKRNGADGGELSIRLQLGDGEDTMLLCSWERTELQGNG